MIVIYDSLTGQVKKFANQLGYQAINIKDYQEKQDDDIFLVTRSINFGQVPKTTIDFLNKYHSQVIACAVSGNKNWGANYGAAGDKINQAYDIPLVLKFELSGTIEDLDLIKNWIKSFINEKEGGKL